MRTFRISGRIRARTYGYELHFLLKTVGFCKDVGKIGHFRR